MQQLLQLRGLPLNPLGTIQKDIWMTLSYKLIEFLKYLCPLDFCVIYMNYQIVWCIIITTSSFKFIPRYSSFEGLQLCWKQLKTFKTFAEQIEMFRKYDLVLRGDHKLEHFYSLNSESMKIMVNSVGLQAVVISFYLVLC